MPTATVDLAAPSGTCKTQIFTPAGPGPWPAVILCFDAGGQRPSMSLIAERITKSGYMVAIPDLFYRAGSPFDLLPPGSPHDFNAFVAIFSDDALRAKFFTTYYAPAIDYDNLRGDIGTLLDHLKARPDVRGGIGTTGYCMGGNVSLRIATLFGDRIAATAVFHGGGLATPTPDSPHLRAGGIKSRVYVAGAIEDQSFTDEAKQLLETALIEAHVVHTIETYPAKHGFAVTDHSVYDAACAERHFVAMDTLFAATLRWTAQTDSPHRARALAVASHRTPRRGTPTAA